MDQHNTLTVVKEHNLLVLLTLPEIWTDILLTKIFGIEEQRTVHEKHCPGCVKNPFSRPSKVTSEILHTVRFNNY